MPKKLHCEQLQVAIDENPTCTTRELSKTFHVTRQMTIYEEMKKLRGSLKGWEMGLLPFHKICQKSTSNSVKGVILHHDNARQCHTSRATKNLVEEFGWEVMHHPPYSPHLLLHQPIFIFSGTKAYFKRREEVEMKLISFLSPNWLNSMKKESENLWQDKKIYYDRTLVLNKIAGVSPNNFYLRHNTVLIWESELFWNRLKMKEVDARVI
ncbi:hypothetical protein ACTXT7_010510 [Hymenolepis weldensis]